VQAKLTEIAKKDGDFLKFNEDFNKLIYLEKVNDEFLFQNYQTYLLDESSPYDNFEVSDLRMFYDLKIRAIKQTEIIHE
jgi:hypothetical protein